MKLSLKKIGIYGLSAAILLSTAAIGYGVFAKRPIYIGSDRQFVWNAALIDSSKTTAEFTLHSPDKQETALSFNEPWEGSCTGGFNVVADPDGYKMYYATYTTPEDVKICLAQSSDGISWEKSVVTPAKQNDFTGNNAVIAGDASVQNGLFAFYDSNPTCDPAEQYKAIAIDGNGQLRGFTSPDGIQWTAGALLGKTAVTNTTLPTAQCSAFWNAQKQRYECYFIGEDAGKQCIRVMESKDFQNWSAAKKIRYSTNTPDFSMQTANIQPYLRSANTLVGLPLRITAIAESTAEANFENAAGVKSTGLTDTIFLTSADNGRFSLIPEAWLSPGAQNQSNWSFGSSLVAGGMAQTPAVHSNTGEDDELSFYVADGMQDAAKTTLARYTLRMDGFASYHAPFNTKVVVTKPLVFDGSRMTLNFKTSTDGYVVVRILDKNGDPYGELSYTDQNGEEYKASKYTSYTMIGDRVDREVAFNADLSELSGQTVMLEFSMSDADIYSFGFDSEPYQSTDTNWQPEPLDFRDYSDYSYADTEGAIHIGTQRQVLWDDYLINTQKTTATPAAHSPVRKEALFKTDLPWEGDNCDFYVILDDTDETGAPYHRMYYLGWDSSSPEDICVCYAYSYDGIDWIKPDLGLHSYTDRTTGEVYTQTNIMLRSEEALFDNFFVMKDPRSNIPESQRYKAICQGSYDQLGYSSYGLWGWVSPDGLHWTKTHRQLPKLEDWFGAFDSVNSLVWDENTQQFFTYFRVREKQMTQDVEWPDFRKIYGAVGKEFEPMDPDSIFALNYGEDAPLFEMYTNNISKYSRAPQMFIGFPTRFSRNNRWTKNYGYLSDPQARRSKFDAGQETRTLSMTDTMFMTSRDGYNWNRQNEAFLTPGPEYQANWIYGNCYPAYGLVQTRSDTEGADNELSMYLFEGKFYNEPTTFYRYALRLDGFRSYKSTYKQQVLVTRPIAFAGSEMQLNFKTSAAGSIQVCILDENGNTIEGYTSQPLVGDNTDRVVSFEKELSELNGVPVILQFTMCDAEIYSFVFQ